MGVFYQGSIHINGKAKWRSLEVYQVSVIVKPDFELYIFLFLCHFWAYRVQFLYVDSIHSYAYALTHSASDESQDHKASKETLLKNR
jgi:hypothetical protein